MYDANVAAKFRTKWSGEEEREEDENQKYNEDMCIKQRDEKINQATVLKTKRDRHIRASF